MIARPSASSMRRAEPPCFRAALRRACSTRMSRIARGRGEEMALAIPAGILVTHQTQVGLVDDGGRLERLAGRTSPGQRRGEPTQLRVDGRQ